MRHLVYHSSVIRSHLRVNVRLHPSGLPWRQRQPYRWAWSCLLTECQPLFHIVVLKSKSIRSICRLNCRARNPQRIRQSITCRPALLFGGRRTSGKSAGICRYHHHCPVHRDPALDNSSSKIKPAFKGKTYLACFPP